MLRSAAVLLFLVAAASAGRRGPLPADLVNIPDLERSLGISDRIVGGEIVEPNSIPFQISMQGRALYITFSEQISYNILFLAHLYGPSILYVLSVTGIGYKVGHRLRELAPLAGGSQEARVHAT